MGAICPYSSFLCNSFAEDEDLRGWWRCHFDRHFEQNVVERSNLQPKEGEIASLQRLWLMQ